MRGVFATLLTAATGVAVFHVLDLPLPFLLGPIFAGLIAALAGVRLRGVGPVAPAMRTVLGVAAGASITPALIDRIGDFALSAALVPLFILTIIAIGYPYFRRVAGFDRATAYYAAAPGGLQDMIAFGREAGGDARALSLAHATRVLVIVLTMPIVMTVVWDLSLDRPPGARAANSPVFELAIMLGCAALGWWGGVRIGLFGAAILGPMALAACASLTDILHGRPPAEIILAAQFVLGMGVGVHYVGVTVDELRRIVAAALGFCAILAMISAVFVTLATTLGAAPLLDAALAFAPGGQAEMMLLAIVAGVDIAYVVTIHIARLIMVILGAPLLARFTRRRSTPPMRP